MAGRVKKGKHKTLSNHLERSVELLSRCKGVTKIVLGHHRRQRHRRTVGSITVRRPNDTGLDATAFGDDGIRQLYIYIDPIDLRDEVAEFIRQTWST